MDRFRMLPSYHYEDNTDGILEKSIGKPLRGYKIYGNDNGVGDKTANMLDFRKIPSSATQKGITFTNNYDGTFTANGALDFTLSTLDLTLGIDLTLLIPGEAYYLYDTATYNGETRRYYLFAEVRDKNKIDPATNQNVILRYISTNNNMNNPFILAENEYVPYIQLRINAPTGELFDVSDLVFSPMVCKYSEFKEFVPCGYKILIKVNDDTYNLYLSNALKSDEYIDYKAQKAFYKDVSENIKLPQIPTNSGTNIITVNTTIQPDKVNYQYYRRTRT